MQIVGVAVASAGGAVGALVVHARPSANSASDVLLVALFAVTVTVAASVASTWTVVVLASVAAVFTAPHYFVAAALVEGIALVAAVIDVPQRRIVGAAVGAGSVQLLLRIGDGPFFGSTALVVAVAVVPVLVTGWQLTRRSVRDPMRRVGYVIGALAVGAALTAAFSLVQARSAANQAIDHVRAGLDLARQGDSQGASLEMAAAANSFSSAHADAGSWWTKPAELLPIVGQQVASVERLTKAGEVAAAAASKATHEADVNSLRLVGGHLDLAKVHATAQPLAEVLAALEDVQRAIGASRSPWLIRPLATRIDALSKVVDRAKDDAELAADAVAFAPALLGGDAPRHYFVIFGNPAEVRDLGGFMGGYGELVADDGRLRLVETGTPADINAKGPHPLSDPSKLTQRLLSLDLEHSVQNVTSSADFPTVSEAIRQVWATTSPDQLDGVLYVDPYVLSALLRLTGPVDAPELERTLSADNVVQFLLHDQYTDLRISDARHDLLSAAAKTVFDKVTSSDLPGPRQLADALAPVAQQRRLLLHSFHPDEQALFAALDVDGAVPPLDGDYLNIAASNLGASKIDQFLTKSTEDDVRFNPDTGETVSTLRVHLSNSSPTSGLPKYIIENGRGLPDGTNTMALSVSTPLTLDAVSVDGQPAIVGPHVENGRNVYTVQLSIAPGATATLEMALRGALPVSRVYSMIAEPQAAVGVEHLKVTVRPVDGWRLVHPDHMVLTSGFAEIDQDLPSEVRLRVGFTPS